MSLVIILVISCKNSNTSNDIIFESKDNKIVLSVNDYVLKDYNRYLEILITNDQKLNLIRKMPSCIINLNNGKKIAKGINIIESVVPANSDYFFSEDDDNLIIIRDDTIILKLTPN